MGSPKTRNPIPNPEFKHNTESRKTLPSDDDLKRVDNELIVKNGSK